MNRKVLITALALLFLIAGSALFFVNSEAVSADKFEEVAVGMTQARVRDILGDPHRVRHDTSKSTAFFYGGFLRLKWCTMEVFFGADERVTGKVHDH